MSRQTKIALRLLLIATYVQFILGLSRFVAPYVGLWLDERIWAIHRPNGILIAAAALVLFRPTESIGNARLWVAARFAPLAPLSLGLGMGQIPPDVIPPFWVMVIHMTLGLVSIGILETAIKKRRLAALPETTAGAAVRQ